MVTARRFCIEPRSLHLLNNLCGVCHCKAFFRGHAGGRCDLLVTEATDNFALRLSNTLPDISASLWHFDLTHYTPHCLRQLSAAV